MAVLETSFICSQFFLSVSFSTTSRLLLNKLQQVKEKQWGFKGGEGQRSKKEVFHSQQQSVTGTERKKMTSQKYALSLFKSKVNWCPKKLRWNLVIFQVSGYLKLPQQKNFPWQSKHGPKDSTNIRVLFCKTKRGGKRSSHYSGGPFTNHCQQRPHKGIETKKKFELTKHGCLGSSKK